ncbi:MAG: class I SAM-dependent methyltransferase [Blastocatellales bacterium]
MSNTIAGKNDLRSFADAMKRDWDERARQDAKWFINSLRQHQSEEEFDETGVIEVGRLVLADLPLLTDGRDPKTLRVLEIGCGAGRMTKHLASIFGDVTGVDVSGEMIRQARARLAGIGNARFHETNGVDFAIYADEEFDLILSAYVFQHVPSAEVIASNIRDGWRVLKPGGAFKFQTNSVVSRDCEQAEKDTWAGAIFPESQIRGFALEAGGRLISIFGAGTQYCWTTIRKRVSRDAGAAALTQPRIVFFGRTVDALAKTIPTEGGEASLTVIVSGPDRDGLDRERVDCNSARVVINDDAVEARYAGPIGRNFEDALKAQFGDQLDHLVQVEIGIPPGVQSGAAKVRLQVDGLSTSDPIEIEFVSVQSLPKIGTVMNAHDDGTDIRARGEKSRLRILVEGLNDTADVENVRALIGGRIVKPDRVSYHPRNAIYSVEAQMPDTIASGSTDLKICFGDLQSVGVIIHVND